MGILSPPLLEVGLAPLCLPLDGVFPHILPCGCVFLYASFWLRREISSKASFPFKSAWCLAESRALSRKMLLDVDAQLSRRAVDGKVLEPGHVPRTQCLHARRTWGRGVGLTVCWPSGSETAGTSPVVRASAEEGPGLVLCDQH